MNDTVDTETRKYKEYELTAMQHAGGWQVHIDPSRHGMSKPVPDYTFALEKETAFRSAELLIDMQISN
jgi:hypothetical protein